jgi:ribosomal protein S18 acetylase RimI-like enzyme
VTPQRATPADYAELMGSLPAFWGERDLRALHHPMFIHEFGEHSLVIRAPSGELAAYLLGFVAGSVGYIHLVGVRDTYRRRGLARTLYAAFEERARGATSFKAITTPANAGSIAFHRALGFTATVVPDYSGPGADRVVFLKADPGR